MKLTPNLSLKKPDYTDPVDIQDLNSNMDIIDVQLNDKADKTYVDNKVKTDVPLGAKFTDTNTTYTEITTAEIDTGTATTLRTITGRRVKYIIDKIVAMFPSKTSDLTNDSGFITSSAIPTSLPANGGNADTVGGFTLGMNVPAGSKLTDTVYSHPTGAGNNHIPSGGTVGQILRNTASGTATWQNENAVGVTSVTAGNGLNFTTISSTGAVTLGTPSTITNATTNSVTSTSHTHALTVAKADVDLGLVDNVKQMPITGGAFTGISNAHNNTSYGTPQLRNISSGTANPSGGSNGDIYFKRK